MRKCVCGFATSDQVVFVEHLMEAPDTDPRPHGEVLY